MFDEKISIVLSVVLLAALFSYSSISALPKFLGIFALIILVSVLAKKISAYYLETRTSVHIWDFRQYWFGESDKFQKPMPIGLVLPLLVSILSYGTVNWLATLSTDFEAKLTKLIRKRKPWSYPGLRDLDVALICFAGFMANIVLAILTAKSAPQIAELSLLYSFYNLLPVGRLDGFHLFMTNKLLYFFTLAVFAAAALFSLILVI